MAYPSVHCASLSSAVSISKASIASASDIPRGAFSRALNMVQESITPYQRGVYRVLLAEVITEGIQDIESGLAREFTSFYDYAWRGSRLLVLLARRTPVARFALFLADELSSAAIDLTTLALGSEVELFPELFDNPLLTTLQQEYLMGQLDNEYEEAFINYTRILLQSVPLENIPRTCCQLESEICWQQGQRYCYDLVLLLQRLVAGNEYNPYNGRALPPTTVSALRSRYASQLLLVRHYLQLKE